MLFATSFMFLLGLLSVHAQQDAPSNPASGTTSQPANSHTPTIQAEARLVVLDVTVTDSHGKPIAGLSKSDFTVLEDGKPQQVKVFEKHGEVADQGEQAAPTDSGPIDASANDKPARREEQGPLNIVLLDAMNTQSTDQMRARTAMLELLKTLPPGRKVAIFTLTNRLKELQSFTSDRDALIAAVNKTLIAKSNLTTENKRDDQEEIARMKAAGLPPQMVANMRQFLEESQSSSTDIRVQITMQALREIAQSVKGYPGRKNLLWVSGSFPFSIQPNIALKDPNGVVRDFSPAIRDTTAALSAAQVAIYSIDPVGLGSQRPDSSYTSRLTYGDTPEGGVETISRDMRAEALDSRTTMEEVATATGGHAFYNRNDIKLAMEHSIDLGSTYYTLAYTPLNRDYDGKLRHITVKLAHKDAHLAYRREYYASHEGSGLTVADKERDLMVALNPESPALTGIHMKAAVNLPDTNGKTKVRFTIAPGQFMADESAATALDLMFVAVGWSAQGEDIGHSMLNVRVPPQKDMAERLQTQPVVVDQEVTVKPGVRYFRVGVLDRSTGQMGTLQADMPASYVASHANGQASDARSSPSQPH